MKVRSCVTCLALLSASGAWAAIRPVAYRLASLPASAQPGQQLALCAANIGTGSIDVTLEFVNVKTGSVVSGKTVSLRPLGSGAASQPCLTAVVQTPGAAPANVSMLSSFAPATAAAIADDGQALIVGVAMVRKPLISFREAQVTASIQVLEPGTDGALRSVATIPLSRTTHPADGAPAYTPPPDTANHHK